VSRDTLYAAWAARFGRPEPKLICIGLNYHDHADEQQVEPPDEPVMFAKLPNALCGAGDAIVLPPESCHVDAEAELAIVIGRTARRIGVDAALDAVAGYTCANDVSARDLQFSDAQWFRSKSFDSFCPIGPQIVPVSELGDARDLRIMQRVNGRTLQDSRTSKLIFGVRELVAYASSVCTLEPGDLILTGTPAGVGYFRKPKQRLADGDVVEIEIEGIGILRNTARDTLR
jgi:2-keto-4-pentenoate hydratase/2-oxohepta-3-ene-1,7-dioic acid hydratase in catechol pathway